MKYSFFNRITLDMMSSVILTAHCSCSHINSRESFHDQNQIYSLIIRIKMRSQTLTCHDADVHSFINLFAYYFLHRMANDAKTRGEEINFQLNC